MTIDKKTRIEWNKFLSSEHGIKGLLYLNSRQPAIPRGESHLMLHDAGRNQGYLEYANNIEELRTLANQEQTGSADSPGL